MKLREALRRTRSGMRDVAAQGLARFLPSGLMCDRKYFHLWEAHGYHVTPVHFYQPIPDSRRLPESLWEQPKELVGIEMREEAQAALLARLDPWLEEYAREKPVTERGDLPYPDAAFLYAWVRAKRPACIIEVGSGISTRVTAAALCRNRAESGAECRFTAIEPFPRPWLREGLPGLSELVERPVQEVSLDLFTGLGEGDLLFIDSSHVLAIGNDVQYEYLEILPRLGRGVWVQVHDIFLPFEYPRSWVKERRLFWTEQYLLQAFLTCNREFDVEWAGQYMAWRRPGLAQLAFRLTPGEPFFPGSCWLRRKGETAKATEVTA